MFTDIATISVVGGNGGNGTVAWRHEKFIAKGGPSGGNGGRGGSVFFVSTNNSDTLSNYSSKKHYNAPKGEAGGGQDKHGKHGEDLHLPVPPGTLIFELDEEGNKTLLADLNEVGQEAMVCSGGRGGYGNAHFKSSVRQRPDFAELGEVGEEKQLQLELKLVADVGIIGYPSVGKSSIITAISAAKPKIAAYEFTTLIPNLGVVTYDDSSYVVCDVPGLIEGAADGKGLGHTFLKHIERCRILLHVLSVERAMHSGGDIATALIADYKAIHTELEIFSDILANKPEYIVLNKTDVLEPEDIAELEKELSKQGIKVWQTFSTFDSSQMSNLRKTLLTVVQAEKANPAEEVEQEETEEVILRPMQEETSMRNYTINITDDTVLITGKRIEQLTKMTNFTQHGGVLRFNDVLERIGVLKHIKKHPDHAVYIGETRLDKELLTLTSTFNTKGDA